MRVGARAAWTGVALAGVALGSGGCKLDVDGLAAPPADASAQDGGALDAAADAGVGPADGALGESGADGSIPGFIVSVGGVQSETGLAQGAHLVYATHSARWWLFYIDDAQPTALQTLSSPDFVTWTPGASLTLAGLHANYGGNFSVAYADLNGADVVHVAYGLHEMPPYDRHHCHVRATIAGATITFGTPLDVSDVTSGTLVEPDGPATVVASDGHVWDTSGWASYMGTGDEIAWESTGFDFGTTWDGVMGAQQNVAAEPHVINARALLPMSGGHLLALWEAADAEPNPSNVHWAQWNGVAWTNGQDVFPGPVAQGANDWDVAYVADTEVHAVRRTLVDTFEHVVYDGSSWRPAAAPDGDPGVAGSGVVALTDGHGVRLFAIGSDAANSVRTALWDGSTWGPWATLEGSPASRQFVSGYASGGHAAIVWTQAVGSSYAVVGRLVSF